MIAARDRDIIVNGLRLHYLEWGEAGRPSLLLIHGSSAHAHWWDFFAPAFADRYRVIAVDLRGNGDSQWAEPPAYDIETHAADVCDVVAFLGLSKPILIGHSLGGLVAIRTAARLAGGVTGLVLIDSVARITARGARYMTALRQFPDPVFASLEEGMHRFRLLPIEHAARPEVLAHVARHALRQRDDGRWTLKFDRRGLGTTTPCDLVPALNALQVPLLLVRGEQSGLVSARVLSHLAASLPGATMVEIPAAHHHVMLDAPDHLVASVAQFVDAIGSDAAHHPGRERVV